MLQNAYLLVKIGADTAENDRHFAEICQILQLLTGPSLFVLSVVKSDEADFCNERHEDAKPDPLRTPTASAFLVGSGPSTPGAASPCGTRTSVLPDSRGNMRSYHQMVH